MVGLLQDYQPEAVELDNWNFEPCGRLGVLDFSRRSAVEGRV